MSMFTHKFVSLLTALLILAGAAACAPSGGQEIPAVGNVEESAALANATDAIAPTRSTKVRTRASVGWVAASTSSDKPRDRTKAWAFSTSLSRAASVRSGS